VSSSKGDSGSLEKKCVSEFSMKEVCGKGLKQRNMGSEVDVGKKISFRGSFGVSQMRKIKKGERKGVSVRGTTFRCTATGTKGEGVIVVGRKTGKNRKTGPGEHRNG